MRHIEEVRGLNDPQRSYRWQVILPNSTSNSLKSFSSRETDRLQGLASTEINQRVSSLIGGPLDLIRPSTPPQSFNASFQVEEVQGLPFQNVDREPFYEAGRNIYFPSIEDISTFSIVFYQDASDNLPNYINEWKRRVVNPNGTKNLPSSYKDPITVKLLNGLNQVTLEVVLRGCFPTQTSGYDLNNQSENLKLTQEFSVDRVEYNKVNLKDLTRKQQIENRLRNKTRQVLNKEAGFPLVGTRTLSDFEL